MTTTKGPRARAYTCAAAFSGCTASALARDPSRERVRVEHFRVWGTHAHSIGGGYRQSVHWSKLLLLLLLLPHVMLARASLVKL